MNYEVNPFQDYESITIDELKERSQQPTESGNGGAPSRCAYA